MPSVWEVGMGARLLRRSPTLLCPSTYVLPYIHKDLQNGNPSPLGVGVS
ncbi:MAG TPA: hypothetical protein VK211_02835 [Kamptonema sp.]|nr:hypothetical protein [Kamptonema sp.]